MGKTAPVYINRNQVELPYLKVASKIAGVGPLAPFVFATVPALVQSFLPIGRAADVVEMVSQVSRYSMSRVWSQLATCTLCSHGRSFSGDR